MKLLKHIPNTITSLNLISGLLSILSALQGDIFYAGVFIFIAAIMDFFDGFAARLLHVVSPIGKELDSLCDVVSFGVAPGMIVFSILSTNSVAYEVGGVNVLPYVSFFIPVLSALRLANFNVDTRQSDSFIGLPVPANALFIASLAMLLSQTVKVPYMNWMIDLFENSFVLIITSLLLSLLLVSPVHMFSLKIKNFSFKDNVVRYVFLILSILLIFAFSFAAVPLIIVLYIAISIVVNYIIK